MKKGNRTKPRMPYPKQPQWWEDWKTRRLKPDQRETFTYLWVIELMQDGPTAKAVALLAKNQPWSASAFYNSVMLTRMVSDGLVNEYYRHTPGGPVPCYELSLEGREKIAELRRSKTRFIVMHLCGGIFQMIMTGLGVAKILDLVLLWMGK